MIRVGPAGWNYKDWAGVAYPEPKPKGFDPLAYLAKAKALVNAVMLEAKRKVAAPPELVAAYPEELTPVVARVRATAARP